MFSINVNLVSWDTFLFLGRTFKKGHYVVLEKKFKLPNLKLLSQSSTVWRLIEGLGVIPGWHLSCCNILFIYIFACVSVQSERRRVGSWSILKPSTTYFLGKLRWSRCVYSLHTRTSADLRCYNKTKQWCGQLAFVRWVVAGGAVEWGTTAKQSL